MVAVRYILGDGYRGNWVDRMFRPVHLPVGRMTPHISPQNPVRSPPDKTPNKLHLVFIEEKTGCSLFFVRDGCMCGASVGCVGRAETGGFCDFPATSPYSTQQIRHPNGVFHPNIAGLQNHNTPDPAHINPPVRYSPITVLSRPS